MDNLAGAWKMLASIPGFLKEKRPGIEARRTHAQVSR